MTREDVLALIRDCLEALNRERPPNKKVEINDQTLLLAEQSALDSLDFVALSVDLEERLRQKAGRDIELSVAAVDVDTHPFHDVSTMASYVMTRLQ